MYNNFSEYNSFLSMIKKPSYYCDSLNVVVKDKSYFYTLKMFSIARNLHFRKALKKIMKAMMITIPLP